MKTYPWIKLYTDFLNDPLIGRLSDPVKLRYVQLELIAGECDQGGALVKNERPLTLADLCWRLHLPEDQLKSELEDLIASGILRLVGNTYIMVDFDQSQGRKVGRTQREVRQRNAQNKRRQRARQKEQLEAAAEAKRDDPKEAECSPRTDAHVLKPVLPLEGEVEEEEYKDKEEYEEDRERESLMGSPALSLYHQITGITPSLVAKKRINLDVDDLEKWHSALEHWMLHGWSPGNLTAILQFYHRGGDRAACLHCPSDHYEEYAQMEANQRRMDEALLKKG